MMRTLIYAIATIFLVYSGQAYASCAEAQGLVNKAATLLEASPAEAELLDALVGENCLLLKDEHPDASQHIREEYLADFPLD